MTGCKKCGEPTQVVAQEGGITEGEFTETVECVNGHKGYVEGEASDPPRAWDRTGQVYHG